MGRKNFQGIIYMVAGVYVLYLAIKGITGYVNGDAGNISPWFLVLAIFLCIAGAFVAFVGARKFIRMSLHKDEEEKEPVYDENGELVENTEEVDDTPSEMPKTVTLFGKTIATPNNSSISDRLKALNVEGEEAGMDEIEAAEEAEAAEAVGESDSARALEEKLTRGI